MHISTTPVEAAGWPSIKQVDMSCYTVLIVVLNSWMVRGGSPEPWVFFPQLVRQGEWWRLVTHAFTHVSWYHLCLDATAFLLLYALLREPSLLKRLFLLVCSVAGSAGLASMLNPALSVTGLCGLSGLAHGLFAVTALESVDLSSSRQGKLFAAILFVGVLIKSMIEAFTGQVVLSQYHGGALGIPIASSHAGGVLGALIAWSAVRICQGRQ